MGINARLFSILVDRDTLIQISLIMERRRCITTTTQPNRPPRFERTGWWWGALGFLVLSTVHVVWAFYAIMHMELDNLNSITPDFAWYYFAFRDIWFHHGHGLYNAVYQTRWLHAHHIGRAYGRRIYAYPPLFALLFAPVGLLSFSSAFWAWNLLSAVSFGALVYLAGTLSSTRSVVRLALWGVALWFFAAYYNFLAGQVDIMIAFLVALSLCFIYDRNRPRLGGGLAALAASLKVTPAIFLVLWVFQRRWRVVVGGLVIAVGGVLFALPFMPFSNFTTYLFHTLGELSKLNTSYGGAPFNDSIKGIVLSTRFRAAAGIIGMIVGILALGIFTGYLEWYHAEDFLDRRLTMAFVSYLVVLASPLIVKRQLIHPGVRQTIHPLGILSYVHHISLDPIVKMVFSVG